MGAYEVWYRRGQDKALGQAYYRREQASEALGSTQTDNRGSLSSEAAPDRETLIDSLSLALCGQGSSKAVMVELTWRHANRPTLIEGDPLPVRLSRSRTVKAAR